MTPRLQAERTRSAIEEREKLVAKNVEAMQAVRQAYADCTIGSGELMLTEQRITAESYAIQQEIFNLKDDLEKIQMQIEPTWDDYYWELEFGSQALQWVKGWGRAELERKFEGCEVTYQGANVTELVRARIEYLQDVWMGNRRKLNDEDFLWAMAHNELSAFKATGLSIAQYRKRIGCEYDSSDQTPKPAAWGEFA